MYSISCGSGLWCRPVSGSVRLLGTRRLPQHSPKKKKLLRKVGAYNSCQRARRIAGCRRVGNDKKKKKKKKEKEQRWWKKTTTSRTILRWHTKDIFRIQRTNSTVESAALRDRDTTVIYHRRSLQAGFWHRSVNNNKMIKAGNGELNVR
ncbi:hypothetical protein F2P81_008400 [Scophthalmus maximus]|uniref:Uncharacterized protein n=1 Tax=Scophthalmus maximus TaxID=52904 RepID=A0A6A4T4X6_SCOMX|nr:hypothetical protein F2P81_008400 [Scophthalmus maximus]